MTDERIRRLIQAELAGEIGMEEEAELQQSLAENPAFSEIYREEKQLSALFKEDRESLTPRVGMSDRIADRVLAQAEKGRRFDFATWARRLSVAAALFLVVGLSFWSGRHSTTATPEKGQAGLIESRDELLANFPEADRTQIRSYYDQAFNQLAEVDQQHKAARIKILQNLEHQIGPLLGEKRKR